MPFGNAVGANVMAQADYLALAARSAGFSSGTANSAQLNKAWRQSSIMAAMLAQFIVDQSGQNAVDDGTTATLEANFLSAIRAVSKQSVILSDTGTAVNNYAATNVVPYTSGTLLHGTRQTVQFARANTGSSIYSPDGLGPYPIYGLNLLPLQGGEISLRGVGNMIFIVDAAVNSGNGAFILLECTGGALQIAPSTKPLQALQRGQAYSAVGAAVLADTGSAANIYSAVNAVPYTSGTIAHGIRQCVQFAHANTGASSYGPDGIGPFPIYNLNLLPLQGGEISLRGVGNMVFIVDSAVNGGNGAFILLNCTGSAPTGRLINVQTFTSSGTYTPTPGMVSCVIEVQGGGAGGAGATVPSAGNVSLGAPGLSGAYGRGRFSAASVGSSQTVTVGAGGAGGVGAAGTVGGSSSVGGLISAPGGIAGGVLNNQVPPQYNGNGTTTAQPTGANISGNSGTGSGLSYAQSSSFGYGGYGGASNYGGGLSVTAINSGSGSAANNYGAGGGGVCAGSGSAILTGGGGKSGIVTIWEYA
ncbi:hypothetical protein POF45_26960 [Pseudomonas sp. 681]|uniref:Glycine-rich domain-containing protein n=1 Tax=Pseudomonas fungipugnans TaxID=3024217 RepID=A0ABT6QWD0_9PSED|nr:hypothetical protein [Pseudomonas sp. 681]MDI2595035.1 hypothetical protein [Pseudomonas sp. 681]